MKLEKITTESRRRYEDACGAAHAMELLGERWAMLVLRELMLGPRRFSDLRAALPGISANVLTQRLEGLEGAGVLVRRKLPPPAAVQVYELTSWGYEAEPIFQALGRWAARSPRHDPTLPLSAVSLFLSFRTMADAQRVRGLTATVGFHIGPEDFLVRIGEGEVTVKRETFGDSDVAFTADATIIAAAVYGGQPLAELEKAGLLKIEGDRALAERFTTLFPLPAKAA